MLIRDLLHGLRLAVSHPGFSLIVTGTLALGLASSTAMFSVVDGVLLRDLPYPAADRLVFVEPTPREGRPHFSPPDFVDLLESTSSFEAITAIQGDGAATLTVDGRSAPVVSRDVTTEVLSVYRVRPLLGRAFDRRDEDTLAFVDPSAAAQPPGAILISHRLWQERFGGSPSVSGQIVELDYQPHQIVGVMPPDFDTLIPGAPDYRARVDVWALNRMNLQTMPRDAAFLRVVARLKPGVTVADARSEAAVFAARQRAAHLLHRDAGFDVGVQLLHDSLSQRHGGSIVMLFGAVGLLLLIACANLVTLQLTRTMARRREFAVRLALGAGRGRVVRQMLAESAVYAVAGAVLALPLASVLTRALVRLAPATIPRLHEVGTSGAAFAFAFVMALIVSAVVAVMPAMRLTRPRDSAALLTTGRGFTGPGRRSPDRIFVVVQVALSVVLLIGSALLVRSLTSLLGVDPGFQPQQVMTADLVLTASRYPRYPRADARVRFVRQLSDRLSGVPGVEAAALALVVPLSRQDTGHTFASEALAASSLPLPPAKYRPITPGYFRSAGTDLVAGRDFDWHDLEQHRLVSIVDVALARRAWPGESAVGKRLRIERWSNDGGQMHLEPLWTEVVGVAESVRSAALRTEDIETVYLPYGLYAVAELSLLVRSASDSGSLAESMRAAAAAVDPEVVLRSVRPLETLVADSVAAERFSLTLLGAFSLTGLILSLVGVYGVLTQFVGLRRRELGVRLALGARRQDVRRGVLITGARLIVAGVALGVIAAAALSGFLGSLLFGVSPVETLVYATVATGMLITGLVACDIPARRASRIDPIETLRHE